MVGDENQSIYRFRNADLEVFRTERSAADESPDRDVLPLLGNFRSRPAVLAAVNEVGRTLLDEFGELTAGRDPAEGLGSAELLLTLDEGRAKDARKWAQEEIDLEPPPVGSPARVIAEARFLAQRLRELVDAREAERGQIVVLLRAFTHVDAYEEALTRAGLRPFVVGGRGYWTQQQVEDLIRLLGVVANPLDDEYLFGALASFANGVSPDALWLLRRAATPEGGHAEHVWPLIAWRYGGEREPAGHEDEWLEAIEAQDAERLERFCRILGGLRAEAPLLTLEELIERTMTAFGYDLGLIAREGGAGRMANVRKLMRLARDYEANEGRDLAGFLALAAESTRRDEREGMAAVQAEGHDGVRVMTVHAAKGLEFDVVAVPDLGRNLNAGHSHGDITIGRPSDDGSRRFGMRLAFPARRTVGLWELVDLNTAESEAEAEEGCRLVYVAASRARDRLILSGVYKPSDLEAADERKPNDTPLRRLLPVLAGRGFAGEDTAVELPAPEPIGGGEPVPPTTRLEIRTSEPGSKRAAELVRSFPPPEEDGPFASIGAEPPLLAEGPAPVPVGPPLVLGARALRAVRISLLRRARARRSRGARARAGRGRRGPAGDPHRAARTRSRARTRARDRQRGARGARMERTARLAPGRRRAARAPARRARGSRAMPRRSPARAGWSAAGSARTCSPSSPACRGPRCRSSSASGARSCAARSTCSSTAASSQPSSTTRPTRSTAAPPPRPRRATRRSARSTASPSGGETGARAIHVFLEAPEEPQIELFDADALRAARAHLSELIGRMRGGEFEVAEAPYAALCFGCPAAARLCPRPAWKPPRP